MAARKTAGKKKSQPGQLRIVAGIWRSRLLQIADVPGLRPTSERVRETLFNWLGPQIHGARCLDLCAGTGALGLEALSRGAARADFVEKSSQAAAVLRKNAESLSASAAVIVTADAERYLEQAQHAAFDIIFLDPPFAAELHGKLCRLLDEQGWLAPNARIYIEMDKRQSEAFLPSSWHVLKNKTAGNVRYILATAQADDRSPD
jgi:16S rRNA (guanine966-N2)-methyltransferase